MVTLLVRVSVIQLLVMVTVVIWAIYSQRRAERIISDLLDRLMCRDFHQYVSMKPPEGKPKPKRRIFSDEEMAELEKQAQEARSA